MAELEPQATYEDGHETLHGWLCMCIFYTVSSKHDDDNLHT